MAIIDSEGHIYIKGRCKNLLLTASGQNIYPEEIESKLNNMPYVSESLVILQQDKLVALVYPDNDDAFAHGLKHADIERAMEENRITHKLHVVNYIPKSSKKQQRKVSKDSYIRI